jgi:hypothetical protein
MVRAAIFGQNTPQPDWSALVRIDSNAAREAKMLPIYTRRSDWNQLTEQRRCDHDVGLRLRILQCSRDTAPKVTIGTAAGLSIFWY